MKSKISIAVAAILSGASVSALADGAAAPADTAESSVSRSSDALAEIVVTAQRRSQNMQDVPISMQALTAETLQQLKVSTFDDYIRYLPNVTAANNGPGQNEIFMRGVSGGSQPSQGSASTGLWPNVAIYLDNQSGQLPNRNLDIYAADLNRIEVLEGPQGTLFGAGAEAGVIRYITNEPKLDVTEANVKAGYGTTAHGDPNTDVTAVLNLPLIANTMAVRAVIYNDTRGGYIDNVPATFTRKNTDIGIYHAYLPANGLGQCPDGLPNSGFCVPPGSPVINNNNVVANNINPVTYQGIRAELLYKFNDDWNALITQSYQDMDSQGVFYQQPYASDGGALQPLQVTLFNSAFNKDRFESTAWTLNGKFGNLNFVYTGGYLVRNVDQVGDYTNYARGLYADYYQCYGPGTAYGIDPKLKPTCFTPSAIWHETERNQHLQNEMRLSTPDDWRLRGIVGAYLEDNKLYDQTAWMYKSIPPCTSTQTTGCLTNVAPFPGTTVQNPGVQGDNTSFYQDQVRDTKQTAFFASLDFDLIPKVLTITAGTRYFQFRNSLAGSVLSSFTCFEAGAPGSSPVTTPGCHGGASYNLNAMNLSDTESGFKSRGNLTWHITPDTMVYYTYSQGFRPGGFNQNGGAAHGPGTDGVPQYILSPSYHSDSLTNNEIGWKTLFFDHRLQWNGAIYRENLDNVQVAFFDPGVIGNIFYNTNGQNYLIKGLETSLIARVTSGLTLQGAAAWNHSEQTNSPELIDNNPASNNYGKPITQVCPGGVCTQVPSPYGPAGAPAANAPPMQFNLRARYEWVTGGGYIPYVQFGATHTDHSFTQAGSNPTFAVGGALSTSRGRFEVPAYSTFDASCGVAKDAWNVDLYVQNLANSNAATFISAFQFIVAETPLRPRVIGGSFGYKF
jgi:iron complex outermembrane recepter protein